LRDLPVTRPNQVWAADITYIPFKKDSGTWSRSWTGTRESAVLAPRQHHDRGLLRGRLNEALALYGAPEIFNSDQGSQFTAEAFTSVLLDTGVKISMDGVGRAIDNVFIERLWRTLKYDHIYLNPPRTGQRVVPASANSSSTTTKNDRTRHSVTPPRRGLLFITHQPASCLSP